MTIDVWDDAELVRRECHHVTRMSQEQADEHWSEYDNMSALEKEIAHAMLIVFISKARHSAPMMHANRFPSDKQANIERERGLISLERYQDYCIYPTVCEFFRFRCDDEPFYLSTTSWRRPKQKYVHKYCIKDIRGHQSLITSCTDKQEAGLASWVTSERTRLTAVSANRRSK